MTRKTVYSVSNSQRQQKMYCSIQTEAFPDLTSEAQSYHTKPITMKAVTNNVSNIEGNKDEIRI